MSSRSCAEMNKLFRLCRLYDAGPTGQANSAGPSFASVGRGCRRSGMRDGPRGGSVTAGGSRHEPPGRLLECPHVRRVGFDRRGAESGRYAGTAEGGRPAGPLSRGPIIRGQSPDDGVHYSQWVAGTVEPDGDSVPPILPLRVPSAMVTVSASSVDYPPPPPPPVADAAGDAGFPEPPPAPKPHGHRPAAQEQLRRLVQRRRRRRARGQVPARATTASTTSPRRSATRSCSRTRGR